MAYCRKGKRGSFTPRAFISTIFWALGFFTGYLQRLTADAVTIYFTEYSSQIGYELVHPDFSVSHDPSVSYFQILHLLQALHPCLQS